MEDLHRARDVGKGAEFFCLLQVCHFDVFTTLVAAQPSLVRVLTEASLHRHDQLTHWSLVSKSVSSSSLLPKTQGRG